VYSEDPGKLWSYWSEVHQIFTQYSKIIAAIKASIDIVIFQSFSECESDK